MIEFVIEYNTPGTALAHAIVKVCTPAIEKVWIVSVLNLFETLGLAAPLIKGNPRLDSAQTAEAVLYPMEVFYFRYILRFMSLLETTLWTQVRSLLALNPRSGEYSEQFVSFTTVRISPWRLGSFKTHCDRDDFPASMPSSRLLELELRAKLGDRCSLTCAAKYISKNKINVNVPNIIYVGRTYLTYLWKRLLIRFKKMYYHVVAVELIITRF